MRERAERTPRGELEDPLADLDDGTLPTVVGVLALYS